MLQLNMWSVALGAASCCFCHHGCLGVGALCCIASQAFRQTVYATMDVILLLAWFAAGLVCSGMRNLAVLLPVLPACLLSRRLPATTLRPIR